MGDWNPSKEDIVKVCEALRDNYLEYDNSSVRGRGGLQYCGHCYEYERYDKDKKSYIEHSIDCPVLIAQDILTGAYEDKQDEFG